MKNIFKFLTLGGLIFFLVSCNDGFDTTYSTFDIPEKGAVVNVGSFADIDFFNPGFPDDQVSFSVSTLGEEVSSINVFKSYNGGAPVAAGTINGSEGNVTFSLSDAADGLVSLGDVDLGDVFTFSFSTLVGGEEYLSGGVQNVAVACPATYFYGTDGHYDLGVVVVYDSYISQDGCTNLFTGFNREWMTDFWGETILDEPGIAVVLDNGTITIPNQYIFTTLYDGAEYPYNISGTGTYEVDGLFVNATIQYTLDQDGFDPSGWSFDNGYMSTPYFEAVVSTNPDAGLKGGTKTTSKLKLENKPVRK